MNGRKFTRAMAVAVALSAPLGAQLVAGSTAQAAEAVTLTYAADGAPDYVTQIDAAADIWNNAVANVKLVKGSDATIVFHENNDGQGSYTQTDGHGNGDIYIDVQQVEEGFDPTRIASHELGHNLGLPDHYEGACTEIMSGHGPGTECTNAVPDATESAQVDENFVNGIVSAQRVLLREAG